MNQDVKLQELIQIVNERQEYRIAEIICAVAAETVQLGNGQVAEEDYYLCCWTTFPLSESTLEPR